MWTGKLDLGKINKDEMGLETYLRVLEEQRLILASTESPVFATQISDLCSHELWPRVQRSVVRA